jgi:UDP-N-acetylmuramoyl-tripeptide--D-alanyl-D-alanine ligase
VALRGERFDGHSFIAGAAGRGASGAIVEKASDAALPQVVVRDAQAALTALAAAWRAASRALVLGVGGSNGKTTTKELLAAILAGAGPTLATRGNLNNHIGVPLSVLSVTRKHKMAVIEMGANHLREIESLCSIALPTFGLITNVGKAHLEGFGGFEGVMQGKGELYAYLAEHSGKIFINTDNAYLLSMSEKAGVKGITRLCCTPSSSMRSILSSHDVNRRVLSGK